MVSCLSNLGTCKAICCKTFFVVVDNMDSDLKKYFELHGLEVIDKTIRFKIPCKMLSRSNRCLINDNKPQICKDFPKNDQPVPKTCIYYKKK